VILNGQVLGVKTLMEVIY